MLENKPLLSVKETAEIVGTCQNTIRNWINLGKLPAVRVGVRLIRVRRVDLAAMITEVGESEC